MIPELLLQNSSIDCKNRYLDDGNRKYLTNNYLSKYK